VLLSDNLMILTRKPIIMGNYVMFSWWSVK